MIQYYLVSCPHFWKRTVRRHSREEKEDLYLVLKWQRGKWERIGSGHMALKERYNGALRERRLE